MGVLASLDQTQLFCPPDRCPATVNAKFVVDTLSMCADGAQTDHELPGDLGPGKLGLEQAQDVQLTLAQRLHQWLRSGRQFAWNRRMQIARLVLLLNFKVEPPFGFL